MRNKSKRYLNGVRLQKAYKYKKKLPINAITHNKPFTPAHLGKTGRDGLFAHKLLKRE